jgi:Ricin-type beta-trefoil lectin domain-like
MYTTLVFEMQKSLQAERSRDAARARRRLPRRYAALVAAIAALILAGLPSLASAQSLAGIAINTAASDSFLVLDVSGGSTSPGAPIIQWYGNYGGNQRWTFVDLGGGSERIVNQQSGMCLTTDGVPGHQVFQWPCNSSNPYQVWFGSFSRPLYSATTLLNPRTGLYLDVSGDSRWAGGQIISWWGNGTSGEYFAYYQL